MKLPKQSANVRREFVEMRYGAIASLLRRHGVRPASTGGGGGIGTYQCNCPGSSTICGNLDQCVCDFTGARCVPPGGGGTHPQVWHF